jgi:hypothetical protein
MKNFKYLLFLCLSAGLFFSCEYDSFEDEGALSGIEGTEQNPFVRIDNTLQGSAAADETDGSIAITLENIFPTEDDVTVNYSLGGTATFGEDYMIAGASATGGSITIPWEETFGIATEDLVIDVMYDCVADAGETIVLTLTSAQGADGRQFNVGQGSLHGSVEIALGDVIPTGGFNTAATEYTDTEAVDTVSVAVSVTDFNADCPPTLEVSVDASSTADAADYNVLNTELVFDGSAATLLVEVEIFSDADMDDETIVLNVAETSSTILEVSTAQHTINITDFQ